MVGLLKQGDRVLLGHRSPQRRRFPDAWAFPGGHVEPGEAPGAALVRELKEELDVVITAPTGPPLAVISTDDFHLELWLIESWTGTPINAAPDEHDDLAWFDLAGTAGLRLAHAEYPEVLARVLTEDPAQGRR